MSTLFGFNAILNCDRNSIEELDAIERRHISMGDFQWELHKRNPKMFPKTPKTVPAPVIAALLEQCGDATLMAGYSVAKDNQLYSTLTPFSVMKYAVAENFPIEVKLESQQMIDGKVEVVAGSVSINTGDKVEIMPLSNGIINTNVPSHKLGERDLEVYLAPIVRATALIGSLSYVANGKVVAIPTQEASIQDVGLGPILNGSLAQGTLATGCLYLTKGFMKHKPGVLDNGAKNLPTIYGPDYCHEVYLLLLTMIKARAYDELKLILTFLLVKSFKKPCVSLDFTNGKFNMTCTFAPRSYPSQIKGHKWAPRAGEITFSQAWYVLTVCRSYRGNDLGEKNAFARMAMLGVMLTPDICEVIYLARDILRFVGNYDTVILVDAGDKFTQTVIEALVSLEWKGCVIIPQSATSVYSRFSKDASDPLKRHKFETVKILPVPATLHSFTLESYIKDEVLRAESGCKKAVVYHCDLAFKLPSYNTDGDTENGIKMRQQHDRHLAMWSTCTLPIFGMCYAYPGIHKLCVQDDKAFGHIAVKDDEFILRSPVRAHNLSCYVGLRIKLCNKIYYTDEKDGFEWDYDLRKSVDYRMFLCQSAIYNYARQQFTFTGVTPPQVAVKTGLRAAPLGGKLISQARKMRSVDIISDEIVDGLKSMSFDEMQTAIDAMPVHMRAAVQARVSDREVEPEHRDVQDDNEDVQEGGGDEDMAAMLARLAQ